MVGTTKSKLPVKIRFSNHDIISEKVSWLRHNHDIQVANHDIFKILYSYIWSFTKLHFFGFTLNYTTACTTNWPVLYCCTTRVLSLYPPIQLALDLTKISWLQNLIFIDRLNQPWRFFKILRTFVLIISIIMRD